MKTFSVKYLPAGSRKTAETMVSALNEAEARKRMSSQGHQVLSIKRASRALFGRTMSVADRLVFFQRLASMFASKVGTSEALEIVYQSFSGVVRDAARVLRDQLRAGASLHEAMERAGPAYFPESVVAIVRTGSRGGDIAYALREAARFEKELSEVKRESGKGLGSALMGFIAGVVTLAASTYYVAPKILESDLVKGTSGVDVGWVMTISNVITSFAMLVAIVVCGVWAYGVLLRPFAPAAVDRGIMKIPFYRDIALAKTNYMVFFGLAVLLKAGLRVEEALRLTIANTPKGELLNDLHRALESVVKGSVQPWPYQMRLLHPTDKAALATAQDRTQIANTIQDLANQYQSLYRSRLELFVPIAQAFAAIFLSLAGFVLFGVSVVPLLQSMSSILTQL